MGTATATRTRVKKTEYENRTLGYVGAVKLNRKDEPEGVAVEPGARIFLSDEEVELTEQAVSRADRSPFKIREIIHFDQKTGEETARFRAAPLSKVEKSS